MVKFAEAEKRGRGGDGGGSGGGISGGSGSNNGMMMQRPKMSRQMFEALKKHILRDRRRKKEEQQEADAEETRRKERESRKKQHAMTLEETRESLAREEVLLQKTKDKKTELFQTLKKVLHLKQLSKTEMVVSHQQYHPQIPTLPVHNQQVLYPNSLNSASIPPSRGSSTPISSIYKISPQQQHSIQQQQQHQQAVSMKRSRSPSPNPGFQNSSTLPYAYKNSSVASIVPVTANQTVMHNKSNRISSSIYQPVSTYYHPASQAPPPPHHHSHHHPQHALSHHHTPTSVITTSSSHPALHPSVHPQFVITPQGGSASSEENKHMTAAAAVYMQQQRNVVHSLESHKKGTPPPEKLYGSSAHGLSIHPASVMSLRPNDLVAHPSSGGMKGGSITSGYPVRAPHVGNGPPVSHQGAHPASSSGPHNYSSSHPRSYYGR